MRILAGLDEPGAKFNDVARRYDLSRGLLWQWREAQQQGRLVAEAPVFVPVRVMPELWPPEPQEALSAAAASATAEVVAPDDRIEIVLPDGSPLGPTQL